MNFSFVEPWHLFLPREGGHLVGISGSGGKTTLLRVFTDLLRDNDVPVIATCTTLCEPLNDFPVVDLTDPDGLEPADWPPAVFLRAGVTQDGKWQGLLPAQVDRLTQQFPDRVILAEVDGAASMPLKYYRPGEPVWPTMTSLAIVTMSMAAAGLKAGALVHRFGKVAFPPLAELNEDSVWQWDHSLALLTEPGGYLEQVPESIPVVLALTNMAQQEDSIGLFDFLGRATAHPRLPLVLMCEAAGEQPAFRTSCRQDEETPTNGER